MKRGADWLAWGLQFVAGFFVGGLVGFGFVSRGSRSVGGWWQPPLLSCLFMVGAALIGAGLASFHGDKLWLGTSYRVVEPEGLQHSDASRRASVMTGLLGVTLVLVAILRHFGIV